MNKLGRLTSSIMFIFIFILMLHCLNQNMKHLLLRRYYHHHVHVSFLLYSTMIVALQAHMRDFS